MNILFLSELFHPHGGGAELATYLYAKILRDAEFHVVVVTNRFAGESGVFKDGDNLTVYRLPLFSGGNVKYSILSRLDVLLSNFMKNLVKWADVVYVPRFWYSAITFAKLQGKPVVLHLHDYFPICPLSNLYNASKASICGYNGPLCPQKCVYTYEKAQGRGLTETLASTLLNSTIRSCLGKSAESSDAIVCVSKAQRDILIERAPSLSGKIHVVYNPLPELPNITIMGDDFGYLGGSSYLKGFYTLWSSIMRIYYVNHTSLSIHATKFLNANKQFAESLSQLGFHMYGKLDSYQYEQVYRQIRAVIVPSIWPEPWPYVVVEAIMEGRFVIASRVGGIPEQVEGCKGTLLCEPGNREIMSEAILFVRSLSRETIVDLGFQNRNTFLKRFNNEDTTKRFVSVCEELA